MVKVRFLWDRLEAPNEFDRVLVPLRDVEVMTNDGQWRKSKLNLIDLYALEDWIATEPTFAMANAIPGWHRYEMEMIRA